MARLLYQSLKKVHIGCARLEKKFKPDSIRCPVGRTSQEWPDQKTNARPFADSNVQNTDQTYIRLSRPIGIILVASLSGHVLLSVAFPQSCRKTKIKGVLEVSRHVKRGDLLSSFTSQKQNVKFATLNLNVVRAKYHEAHLADLNT